MVKAYGYCRVSGISQADNDGFTRQTEAIRRYAKANGIEVVEIFSDTFTGTEADRPEMARLMVSLEQNGHGIKTVIVEKLDRLARDLMIQEAICRDFREMNVALVSATEGADLDSDDPTRKLVRQMFGAIAEYEKSMIVLKLRMARERKRQKTGRCEGRKFTRDTNPEIIAEIKRLYRKPRGKPRPTLQAIADKLNAGGHTTQLGRPFTRGTVHHVLKSNGLL